jgi:hypothetical protein
MSEPNDRTIALNVQLKPSDSSAHPRAADYTNIKVVQSRQAICWWSMVCGLVVLVGSVLCFVLPVEAKSDYDIINTGISGGGCWLDDQHFVVEQRVQRPGAQDSELEGLYMLDPNKPNDLRRIDLSLIEANLQKRIHTVSCQGQTLVFYLRSDEPGLVQIYGLKIGSQPELIAEMRRGSVNLAGRYVLNKFRRPGAVEAEGLQGIGIYEAHPDCGVKYVKPGFKTLCLDTWMEPGWGLPNFRLIRYTWYETVKVKDKNGQEKWIPNPEPPLRLADGTELKHGYLLRDLDNRLIQQIKMEQPPYQIYRITLRVDPTGEYVYASCSKASDHGEKHYDAGGRVCRYKLDGTNRLWEEVFAVQQSPKEIFSLQDLDVNRQGDVVAIHRGRSPQSLWKYRASSRKVEFVTRAGALIPDLELGAPLLSSDGRWVSFMRRGEFYLAHHKGDRP